MTSISIVTPWLAHHELAEDYIAAVLPELEAFDEVLVVDNGGAPDMPAFFTVIDAGDNLGFAGGSNLGMEHARCEAVLFLNNDVALGTPGWLGLLREVVCPGVFCGPVRGGPHTRIGDEAFDYIDGWCLAGMRADLVDLGGFHDGLEEPSYYSDNILCLEARMAGIELRDVAVPLRHKESVTAEPDRNPLVPRAAEHNRAIYLELARAVI